MGHPLDNPIWSSLVTRHRRFAMGEGLARRFDPEIAPFAGIAAADDVALRDLAELASPGDWVGRLNVFPGLETQWKS